MNDRSRNGSDRAPIAARRPRVGDNGGVAVPSVITAWLLEPDAVDPRVVDGLRRLLDDDEARRAGRFAFDADRLLFTVAHGLARLALSEAVPDVAPEAWRFVTNAWGRPSLAAPFERRDLHFNLSHTRGLAACVVGGHQEIGIDVEDGARPFGGLAVAERFFAVPEVAALRHVTAEDRRDLFFRFWTLKEAYIKARGRGISLGLGRFWFDVSGPAARIAWDAGLDQRPESWRFPETSPTPRHRLALAIRDADAPEPLLIHRAELTIERDRVSLAAISGRPGD